MSPYSGRQFDAETGLYYNRARYYHPRLGQFMQTDPIGFAGGMNLYGYTEQDPLNATDPSGAIPGVSEVVVGGGSNPGGWRIDLGPTWQIYLGMIRAGGFPGAVFPGGGGLEVIPVAPDLESPQNQPSDINNKISENLGIVVDGGLGSRQVAAALDYLSRDREAAKYIDNIRKNGYVLIRVVDRFSPRSGSGVNTADWSITL